MGVGTLGALAGGLAALQQVPTIAKRVVPDRDPAIGFLARGLFKQHYGRAHRVIICGKGVTVQKEPDVVTSLLSNRANLGLCGGLDKDYFSVRQGPGGDYKPPFFLQ